MAERDPLVWVYLLAAEQSDRLCATLGPILEKCLGRGWRVLILGKTERLQALDEALWTWRDTSFLPHGMDDPSERSRLQPILLSASGEAVNGAQALILFDGAAAPQHGSFERIVALVMRDDASAVDVARQQYRKAVDDGDGASCFVQAANGRWEAGTAF